MSDPYIRCEDCGAIIRYGADRLRDPSRDEKTPPLQYILNQQKRTFGRRLCKKCALKAVSREGIRDMKTVKRLVP